LKLANELIHLSDRVDKHLQVIALSAVRGTITLSGDEELKLPYIFKCEALHPGIYKGFTFEEIEIMKAKNTIFETHGNYHNFEINKDHNNSRNEGSSVDDIVGKVTEADYDTSKRAYMLTGEVYDKAIASKIHNGLIKYVSLRISPGMIDFANGQKFARNLKFEELSFVRAPGDPNAKILR